MKILNKKLISRHIYYTPFIYGKFPTREQNIILLIEYLNKIQDFILNWNGKSYKDYYKSLIKLGVKPQVVHRAITLSQHKHLTFNSRGIIFKLGLYDTYRDNFNNCVLNEIKELLDEIKNMQRYK